MRTLRVGAARIDRVEEQYLPVPLTAITQDEEFIARRSLIVDGFNAITGVSCVMPHGAFYAFPNMSSFGRSSNDIADHLLYDAGVCGLSGTAFGSYGEGYLRFSYANSREKISAALERVGESLAKLERTGELVHA